MNFSSPVYVCVSHDSHNIVMRALTAWSLNLTLLTWRMVSSIFSWQLHKICSWKLFLSVLKNAGSVEKGIHW